MPIPTLIGWKFRAACLLALLVLPGIAPADEFEIQISGIEGALLKNVKARTSSFRVTGNSRLSRRRLEQMSADAVRRAKIALRPLGYYHAEVRTELRSAARRSWVLELQVDPGPPVLVADVQLEITGPGALDPALLEWKADWPLVEGSILNQAVWEEQKIEVVDRGEEHGFLNPTFTEQRIELDLVQNRATLRLILDTGEQALMNEVVFNQDLVYSNVLENLLRFEPGQPYDAWLMEQFRLDLWRTGYFSSIEVLENRKLEQSPPTVDLEVNLEPRKRNTLQGSFGYGTDSGLRLQGMWNRHLLSKRGDSLDLGFGWKQQNNEFNLRTTYRHPRRAAARQFWMAELGYRTEKEEFKVRPNGEPEREVTLARGNVNDYSFRPGWLIIRNLEKGFQQIFEHWFVDFLREKTDYDLAGDAPPIPSHLPGLPESSLSESETSATISPGVNWHWPMIRGNGFQTVGHSHRAWIFTSNKAWGSDLDFTQVYLSSRWNRIFGKRWKLLLRGEVGYSDAKVNERVFQVGDDLIGLSVTELPSAYRFKAGGSQSVRGYGFEDLSNNNIGSNNIVTASAEIEYLFRDNWSAALFMDVGNAFNDWDDGTLKKGVGVGIRWYSIAGPIRLDLAQALDEPDKPWRIHFTIGSPLL